MTNAISLATLAVLNMLDQSHAVVHELPWSPGGRHIPFLVGTGAAARLGGVLSPLAPDRLIVVADPAVRPLLPELAWPATVLLAPGREASKTLAWLDHAACRALQEGATRRSVVLSFGGGLACNLAGMLAATLFRGLRLIHLPTTLLAMHDTVTSLKQAVNVGGHKNLLGVYHAPDAILCDTDLLRTLPAAHVQAAMVEIIKNGLILGEPFATQAAELCARRGDFAEIIAAGVAAKQSLMAADPCEKGRAVIFEYGHTVGHAIEAAGELSHGQCIYWGMLAAGRIARELDLMPAEAHAAHDAMLRLAGEVARPPMPIRREALLDALAFDNKRGHLPMQADHVAMVLLTEIGKPVCTGGLPLVQVPLQVLRTILGTLPFTA